MKTQISHNFYINNDQNSNVRQRETVSFSVLSNSILSHKHIPTSYLVIAHLCYLLFIKCSLQRIFQVSSTDKIKETVIRIGKALMGKIQAKDSTSPVLCQCNPHLQESLRATNSRAHSPDWHS